MTRKRKRYPDLAQKLERPWCYYCERDFDDLKILISHQKAKHFKCDRCGRRLNTAGGLSVHMNQVHKENLTHVENASPGRQGLEIEIFGMEGVPADVLDQHNQHVTQAHFAEEQERARLTGNPVRGLYPHGHAPPTKRPKMAETLEAIEERAAKYRIDRRNGVLPPHMADVLPAGFAPGPPAPTPSPSFPFTSAHGAGSLRSTSIPIQSGALPPRPGPGAPPPALLPPGHHGADFAVPVHSVAGEAAKDVTPVEKKEDKKSRKDKNMKLIFSHENTSPEEKMAALARFANFTRT